jgi:hypothetical protein
VRRLNRIFTRTAKTAPGIGAAIQLPIDVCRLHKEPSGLRCTLSNMRMRQ